MSQADADLIRAKLHASWQFRAEQFTRGNQTAMGAIVLAVLRRRPHEPPAIGGKAVIGRDGWVYASYLNAASTYEAVRAVCSVADLTNNFRRLADALKLTDTERKEMFDEVKKWIVRDFRAVSDENLFDDKKVRQ